MPSNSSFPPSNEAIFTTHESTGKATDIVHAPLSGQPYRIFLHVMSRHVSVLHNLLQIDDDPAAQAVHLPRLALPFCDFHVHVANRQQEDANKSATILEKLSCFELARNRGYGS